MKWINETDAFAVFQKADAFLYASEMCFQKGKSMLHFSEGQTLENPQYFPMYSAAFTNQALALELFLKCIHVMERKKFPKSHDLLALFRLLNEDTKQDLRQFYTFMSAADPWTRHAVRETNNPSLMHLDYVLGRCSEAFEHWRYYLKYDIGGNNMFAFLKQVMAATETLICSKQPTWARISYTNIPAPQIGITNFTIDF